MSTLRSDLIRLASRSTPEAKAAILPLLVKSAAPRSQVEDGAAAEEMGTALDEAYDTLSKLLNDGVFVAIEEKGVVTGFREAEARKLNQMFKALTRGVTELRAALQKEWGLED